MLDHKITLKNVRTQPIPMFNTLEIFVCFYRDYPLTELITILLLKILQSIEVSWHEKQKNNNNTTITNQPIKYWGGGRREVKKHTQAHHWFKMMEKTWSGLRTSVSFYYLIVCMETFNLCTLATLQSLFSCFADIKHHRPHTEIKKKKEEEMPCNPLAEQFYELLFNFYEIDKMEYCDLPEAIIKITPPLIKHFLVTTWHWSSFCSSIFALWPT